MIFLDNVNEEIQKLSRRKMVNTSRGFPLNCRKPFLMHRFVESIDDATLAEMWIQQKHTALRQQMGVVTYNHYLSQKKNCHINVDCAGSVQSVKYLVYIYKRPWTYRYSDQGTISGQ